MTKLNYDKYKAMLEAERDQLVSSLEQMAFRDDQNPGDWVPRREDLNISDGEAVESFELAEEIEEYENATATVKELEGRLNEVLAALERIENGTYGVDEVDGNEIPLDRLEANPAARTTTENAPRLEQEPKPANEID